MNADSRRITRLEEEARDLRSQVADLLAAARGRRGVVHGKRSGGAELFYYQLTADMAVSGHLTAQGEATGTLSPLSGSGSAQLGQTVYDYTGTAAHQVSGDKGLALKAGSEFIVIEPECNFENFNPNDPGPGPA